MKKRALIALSVLLLLSAAVYYLSSKSREPSYQGRPLSAWLDDLYHSNEDDGTIYASLQVLPKSPQGFAKHTSDQAEVAIRHIGTNALPTLIKMLQSKDSKLKMKLLDLASRQTLVHVPASRTH